MSAPWIAALVCLWVLVLALAVVVAAVLRRLAAILETPATAGRDLQVGPPTGKPLPALPVRRGGDAVRLSALKGPFILLVLSSQCEPCQAIVTWLSAATSVPGQERLVILTDSDERVRLDANGTTVLVCHEWQLAMRLLQVPATPFAIQTDSDSRVVTCDLVAGDGHLQRLLATFAETLSGRGAIAEEFAVPMNGIRPSADEATCSDAWTQ